MECAALPQAGAVVQGTLKIVRPPKSKQWRDTRLIFKPRCHRWGPHTLKLEMEPLYTRAIPTAKHNQDPGTTSLLMARPSNKLLVRGGMLQQDPQLSHTHTPHVSTRRPSLISAIQVVLKCSNTICMRV